MSPFIISKSEGLTSTNDNEAGIFAAAAFIKTQPEPSRLAQVTRMGQLIDDVI